MKKNNKGFTLVELIVVLVILAILAAILVPALLGYIDKARQGQYAEEAHSILTAAQAYNTEQYAKGDAPLTKIETTDTKAIAYINKIVSPTKVVSCKTITPTTAVNSSISNGTSHQKYTIGGMEELVFTSQNENKKVKCTLVNGEWDIISVE